MARKPMLSNADRQRDYRQRNAAGRLNTTIDPEALAKLKKMAEAEGVTLRRALELLISKARNLK